MDEITAEVKQEYVRKQTCFAKLTPQETEVLATLLKEKHIPAGTTIVNEGEYVDSVYLIVSGKADVRNVRINEDKTTQIQSIATLGKDDAIGLNEYGFYSISGVRTATVVALTDMVVLSLSVAAFHGFALAYSHVNELMRQQADEYLQSSSSSS